MRPFGTLIFDICICKHQYKCSQHHNENHILTVFYTITIESKENTHTLLAHTNTGCAYVIILPRQNKFSCFPSTARIWLLSVSLFRILPLFSGTDCKSYLETVSAHVSAVLSRRHRLHVCAILQLKKERTSLSMSFYGFARQIMA